MRKKNTNLSLVIFLLGIFMGAIDSGIVSPARTVINNSFGVSSNLGVWIVTIYTLAYAVSMPISSKLSDRFGRKKVYRISIIIFTLGSAFCGLTNFYGTFSMLLISRVIQAIGGGGIIPIATAYIGQSFPPEKRGSALGFVGSIYGVATVLGPTLGSSILSLAGSNHWGWIFFINVPISIIILILSYSLEENKGIADKKMDMQGSIILSIVILSLMYALTNLDFFSFSQSIKSYNVWPFLLIFVLALPLFIIIEKKSEDPIMNLNYFKSGKITITLAISFIVGCGLMGVVFVPQFAENTLRIKSGSGGYLVTLMALFAGIGAPVGGKLIDKFSAKLVMLMGFSCTILGMLYMAFVTVTYPGFINIFIGLILIGLGMGFTMGTPLNYLMLSYVKKEESASALSTLSLLRSIGVTISPNIMINFISEAGKQMPTKLAQAMPKLNSPSIPGMPTNVPGIPNLSGNMNMLKMTGSMNSLSGHIDKLKSADVTTVVNTLKSFMSSILDKITPQISQGMKSGINSMLNSAPGGQNGQVAAMAKNINVDQILVNWKSSYINNIELHRKDLENIFQTTLNHGFRNMFIAAAIIAAIGLILTIILPKHNPDIKA